MITILNIETATKNCSVSLTQNGTLIAHKSLCSENYSHSETLHVFVKELVEESQLKMTDLNAVAVSKGPGSYTGLRIGVSAAKGLCFGLEIPLISVETLKLIAAAHPIKKGVLVPMIDARRMEVYTANYNKYLERKKSIKAVVITPDLYNNLNETYYFLGDGSQKCKEIFTQENHIFIEEIKADAKYMVEISYLKFLEKDFEDTAYFEPYYLKDFIALKPKKLF